MAADLETPGRILDAAEELFAKQGFAATTIKQIGAAAGVNPALLYYYFGNKETLYRALLQRLFTWFTGEGLRRLGPAPAPPEAIRALLAFQAQALAQRPTMPKLLVREMMEGGQMAAEQFTQLAAGLFKRVCDLIEEGQASGVFRRDLDPRFMAFSTVSLIPFAHIGKPVFGHLMGRGAAGPAPEDMDAYGRHVADFVLAGLTAPRGAGDGDRGGETG